MGQLNQEISRESLLLNIKETKKIVSDYVNLSREYQHYFKRPFKVTIKRFLLVSFICSAIPFQHLFYWLVLYGIKGFFLYLFLSIMPFILLTILLNVVYYEIRKRANHRRINEILQLQDQYVNSLSQKSFISDAFWNVEALTKFEKYLINQEADTLKECINLYRAEKRHFEHMNNLASVQRNLADVRNYSQGLYDEYMDRYYGRKSFVGRLFSRILKR